MTAIALPRRLAFNILALCLALAMTSAAHAAKSFAGRDDVRDFIAEMVQKHGFDHTQLLVLFGRIKPLPAVIKAIRPPADPGIRSWQAYRSRFVEPRRITAGLHFWQTHADTLATASTHHGVPEEIIVAIIGIETIYGRHTGSFSTLAALATLAFDYPPRADLFRRELEALLLLAREEGRNPLDYHGSYAGALGLPQFLPSSARQWAVDFNADGHIDLASSPADAIGSVANFLQAHGWERGTTVATPATIAAGSNPQPLVDEGIRPQRLPATMAPLGVHATDAQARPAALIDLVTPGAPTEYWLGYQNFYVITRYNKSSFYAMAVFQLAEALRMAREHPGNRN